MLRCHFWKKNVFDSSWSWKALHFFGLKVFQGDKVGIELTTFQQVKQGCKGGKTGAAVVGITPSVGSRAVIWAGPVITGITNKDTSYIKGIVQGSMGINSSNDICNNYKFSNHS